MASDSSPVNQHQTSNTQDPLGPQDINSDVLSDASPVNQGRMGIPGPHKNFAALQAVAAAYIDNGINAAAIKAALYLAGFPENNGFWLTSQELTARENDAMSPQGLGQEKYTRYNQNRSNAVALRLLHPPPRPDYGFEASITTVLQDGKEVTGRKCRSPSCEFRGDQRPQHAQQRHIFDVTKAFCCPYKGCHEISYRTQQYYVNKHIQTHEYRNDVMSAESNV